MPKRTILPVRRYHALLQQQVVLGMFCLFFQLPMRSHTFLHADGFLALPLFADHFRRKEPAQGPRRQAPNWPRAGEPV